jgi:hypothetical protein
MCYDVEVVQAIACKAGHGGGVVLASNGESGNGHIAADDGNKKSGVR